MKTMLNVKMASALVAVGLGLANTEAALIQLGRTNYFQNFDTLNSSGKSKSSLPAGWSIFSQDGQIYADDGSASMANIYSYGLAGSQNRALGALTSGGNSPIFGASFQNASGGAINRLNISYTGEEWRLGVAGHANTLNFQYSLNASGLNDKMALWINVPGLSFTTPNLVGAGAHDGTLAANQTQLASSIGFLNIAQGATFWIRWNEPPPGSPGDGLAVDNFNISAVPEASTLSAGVGLIFVLGFYVSKRSRSLKPNVPRLS